MNQDFMKNLVYLVIFFSCLKFIFWHGSLNGLKDLAEKTALLHQLRILDLESKARLLTDKFIGLEKIVEQELQQSNKDFAGLQEHFERKFNEMNAILAKNENLILQALAKKNSP